MRAATLFSGIGAPEVAMPEWEWLWHAEIEKFPSAVMAQRHPSSVNLGDVTRDDFSTRALDAGRPDVLVFGSPCQSFSVAGRRLGLDDPRGNLALVALGIVARLEPTWFVFENVPGLLSSDDGRDFGLFLRTVDELGYHVCWRMLDAQYAGLAQRRLRLFAVGHARDWRRAVAVLLEPESLCGHPPTRGEAGQDTAGGVAPSLRGSGPGAARTGDSRGQDPVVIGTLGSDHGNPQAEWAWTGQLVSSSGERARALTTSNQRIDYETETLIAHSLRADGFDASEDGTGRGTPLVAVFDPTQVTSAENRSQPTPELSHTLPREGYAPVAYQCQGTNVGEMGTLRSGNGNETGGVPFLPVAFDWQSGGTKQRTRTTTRTSALSANQTPAVMGASIGGDERYNTQRGPAEDARSAEALRVLWRSAGEEAFTEWSFGILAPFWPSEVLRSPLYGEGLRREGISFRGLVHLSLSRAKADTGWPMRTLWEAACVGRPPSGWELPQQSAYELAAHLSLLPYAPSPAEAFLRLVWQASEGSRLLRQALSAIQEARRSACLQTQPAHAAGVRRLTADECEALQGFPRGYTAISYRGKPAKDGPRYKAIGNSMAVPVVRWILERIEFVDRLSA